MELVLIERNPRCSIIVPIITTMSKVQPSGIPSFAGWRFGMAGKLSKPLRIIEDRLVTIRLEVAMQLRGKALKVKLMPK